MPEQQFPRDTGLISAISLGHRYSSLGEFDLILILYSGFWFLVDLVSPLYFMPTTDNVMALSDRRWSGKNGLHVHLYYLYAEDDTCIFTHRFVCDTAGCEDGLNYLKFVTGTPVIRS